MEVNCILLYPAHFQTCPWFMATCTGFKQLIAGNPGDAHETFLNALDEKRYAGQVHPHLAIASNYSYMGLASYELDKQAKKVTTNEACKLDASLKWYRR